MRLSPGSVADLNVASVQLLLRTRGITKEIPIDGIVTPRLETAVQRAWCLGDWTGPPPADRLLDWMRALEPRNVEVPRVRTPMGSELLRGVLHNAHLRVFLRPASVIRVLMASAHMAAVHGSDMTDLWVWNIGNWSADDAYHGAWCRAPGGERRAYAEPLEGAVAHLELMAERYEAALDAFDDGEPERVAELLRQGGWPAADREFVKRFRSAWDKIHG